MNEVVDVKFLHCSEDLLENFLYGELLLAGYYLIEVSCEPLHHHDWLILPHKCIQDLHQVRSIQDLEDVLLPHEANRQSNFAL